MRIDVTAIIVAFFVFGVLLVIDGEYIMGAVGLLLGWVVYLERKNIQ